jgi:hypothetical protein
MAEAVKRKPGGTEEDIKQAQSVDEIEREMLGPKTPKEKKEKGFKAPKEKKPVGRVEVAVLTSLLWLSLMFALALFVVFDPTPDAVVRGNLLLLLNPEELTREEYFAPDIIALQDEWRELEEERKALDEQADELSLREEDLDEREADLNDREDELEFMRETVLVENGTSGITADIARTANVMGRMTPSNAAVTLQEMDFDGALRICALIAPKRLAPILDAMDPDFRVELVDAMSAEPEPDDWDW